MAIPLVDLHAQLAELDQEIRSAIDGVLRRGDFILGRDVQAFEEEFAAYCGVRHCVGVGSGLDALVLAMRAAGIGPGDEVITVGNTFIATALAILHAGATPVIIDNDPETYNLDPRRLSQAITSRTKAIVPVHLYGQPADMDEIGTIAAEHGVAVIEDAAQAHGATYKGRRCGSLGLAAAFSFYPGKNLGGMGDGGAVVTNDAAIAEEIRKFRNYGMVIKGHHESVGFNTRLDTIQAAVLRVKLRHLDRWNELRRRFAEEYCDALAEVDVELPVTRPDRTHVFHLFVVRSPIRDRIMEALQEESIFAGIHYPRPVHEHPALRGKVCAGGPLNYSERYCNEVLSLPMHPHLSHDDLHRVVEAVTSGIHSHVEVASQT